MVEANGVPVLKSLILTTAEGSRPPSDKIRGILSAISCPSDAVATGARLGRETIKVTVSIAPFSSLRQPYSVEDLSALDNAHVRSALAHTYAICHSDKAFDEPKGTRARLSTMLSRYNRMIADDRHKHRNGILDDSVAPPNSKLCVMQLSSKDVPMQPNLLDEPVNVPPDYVGRLDYDFELDEEKPRTSVRGLCYKLSRSGIEPSGRGLEEANIYDDRDAWADSPTEDERTGLLISEEKNRHQESV